MVSIGNSNAITYYEKLSQYDRRIENESQNVEDTKATIDIDCQVSVNW